MRKTIYIVLAALGLVSIRRLRIVGQGEGVAAGKTACRRMAAQNVERRSSAGFRCLCLLRRGPFVSKYTNGSSRWATRSIRGKYEVKNDVLGGVYSDGKPFGSTYDIAFDEVGQYA